MGDFFIGLKEKISQKRRNFFSTNTDQIIQIFVNKKIRLIFPIDRFRSAKYFSKLWILNIFSELRWKSYFVQKTIIQCVFSKRHRFFKKCILVINKNSKFVVMFYHFLQCERWVCSTKYIFQILHRICAHKYGRWEHSKFSKFDGVLYRAETKNNQFFTQSKWFHGLMDPCH